MGEAMRNALLTVLIAAAFLLLAAVVPMPAATHSAGYTIKIGDGEGHGSGVHIGRGYILTAAHVVASDKKLSIITDTGSLHDVEVLWRNADYDVALLKLASYTQIAHIKLSCTKPKVGTKITAYGSPLSLDFVSTSGTLVGHNNIAMWKETAIVDATIIMGMSGGPVVSDDKVIGISVGVVVAPMGFSASITGLGVIVPGNTICRLMAR